MDEGLHKGHFILCVNGSPTTPTATSRGLRQGDPLSPFIFTLVGGSLHRLVEKARELGIVRGFGTSPNGPIVMGGHHGH